MGHKLAGLIGIVAATLAFGIGAAAGAGQLGHPAVHHSVADVQNPTSGSLI